MKLFNLLFALLLLSFLTLESLPGTSAQTVKARRLAINPTNVGTYPAGTYPVSGGLRVVGVHSKVYYTADTTGTITGFTWTVVSAPTGSSAAFSSSTSQNPTFTPDTAGQYVISVAGTGASAPSIDTIYAELYFGTSTSTNCAPCHSGSLNKFPTWSTTGHANMFKNGITGELSPAPNAKGQMVGTYGATCFKCHTTGWDQTANNGNFAYVAHQTGYDTLIFKNATPVGSMYQIIQGDQTAWNILDTTARFSNVLNVATIGCEQCHGPATAHVNSFGKPQYIDVSTDAGLCLQCHNAPPHHTVGTFYLTSNHASLPLSGNIATRTSCFPCHSGTAFLKYTQNQTTPGYTLADASQPISCAACHDPHVATNFGLRIVAIPNLMNGYAVTSGGNGQICMTCHRSRANINTAITNVGPYYGFSDRFGPHHGPQTDMFFGQNAYQYGDSAITGLMTHGATQDACVTCHMSPTSAGTANHRWEMTDTTGADVVTACRNCHGPNINNFTDIQANSDLDGNGKIEGFQTEVQGMLNTLKSLLPMDSQNPGQPVDFMYDSLLIKGKPAVIQGIYTYYFVANDNSFGVHNPKYTTAILQLAISALGGVTPVELTSLQAAYSNNTVNISWETATETNNKGFEIQRSQGSSWSTIGYQPGAGSTVNVSRYNFVDNNIASLSGNVKYRINQIDMNGTSHLSREISVALKALPQTYSLSQNYPNPFNPSTIISFSLPKESNVKIVVYSITGSVVKTLVNGVQSAGEHEVTLTTNTVSSEMASGVYLYSIEAVSLDGTKSFSQVKKMVLMK